MLTFLKGWHNSEMDDMRGEKFDWHIGEPLPILGRVVTLQVDGDELGVIEWAPVFGEK